MTLHEAIQHIYEREEVTPGGAVITYRSAIIRDCVDHVWAVEDAKHATTRRRRIMCWIIATGRDGCHLERITEADHPAYADCPTEFFELVPNVECREWRDWVWSQVEEGGAE